MNSTVTGAYRHYVECSVCGAVYSADSDCRCTDEQTIEKTKHYREQLNAFLSDLRKDIEGEG